MNYYNEIEPYAAQWLRNLIEAGLIPRGDVDERSIEDVQPDDLKGYTQCHFFAGIGGWPLALALAEWPEDRAVWTGSCPCQPFSSAGKQKGTADERHLWPTWFRLIDKCKPPIVFGEQVASAIRHGWLDDVFDDMEGIGYACGASVLPANSVGAPHKRDRVFFGLDSPAERRSRAMEHAVSDRSQGRLRGREDSEREVFDGQVGRDGTVGGLADANGWDASAERKQCSGEQRQQPQDSCAGRLVYQRRGGERMERPREIDGFWRAADWLFCRDGKWRPVEPGTFPLAHGLPKGVVRVSDPSAPINAVSSSEACVMRLRGYGNAIVPQVAARFIQAFDEARMIS